MMTPSDAHRWDERYRQDLQSRSRSPRPLLVENAGRLPVGGLALDVAMGPGTNAAYLLERGLQVVGVDVSAVAVGWAKARWPELMAVVADLNHFCLPGDTFDVVLNFYYLQRELWSAYRRILKPGGLLLIETFTQDMLAVKGEIDPQYLLEPGELRAAFQDWDILVYREGWVNSDHGNRRAVASLAARRPTF